MQACSACGTSAADASVSALNHGRLYDDLVRANAPLPYLACTACRAAPDAQPDKQPCARDESQAGAGVLACETKLALRWSKLSVVRYIDPADLSRTVRTWEVVGRTTRQGDVDGVNVVARIPSCNEVVLVSQFRPPVNSVSIEFPSGLIDKGESSAEAAVRELREETGYTGYVVRVDDTVVNNDPGISAANTVTAFVQVDEAIAPSQQCEPGEFVTVHRAPLDHRLPAWLRDTAASNGWAIEAHLYCFAMGLQGFPLSG